MEFCVTRGRPLRIHEAEEPRGELAVDGQRGAGDGAAAERAPVGVVGHSVKARDVAVQHLHPGQQVVGERHGLRALQMGVARDRHRAVAAGHAQQGALPTPDFLGEHRAGVLEKQPHVGRDLVVAAARGVQPGGGRHPPGERLLDVHVHILQLRVPDEPAGIDGGEDVVEPGMDSRVFPRGEQADAREHGRVRLAARDVKRGEPVVERDGFAELQHQLGGAGGEPPAPGDVGLLGHGS